MKRAFGWRRDLTDVRDFTVDHEPVKKLLRMSAPLEVAATVPQPAVDLRPWFSPVEDQGNLGSCTANAAAGLVEYYEKRAHGRFLDASRLFIYKATRILSGDVGDTGAELRTTMQALAMFGVPEEKHYPYVIEKFDQDPPSQIYAMASNFKATKYYRHDPAGSNPSKALQSIKTALAAGLPSMFGMSIYSSFPGMSGADDGSGNVPFPTSHDRLEGGHAMVFAGYDDNHMVGADKGAFLVRNSWGEGVGQKGYFWVSYRQLLSGLVSDVWSLVQESFIDTSLFT